MELDTDKSYCRGVNGVGTPEQVCHRRNRCDLYQNHTTLKGLKNRPNVTSIWYIHPMTPFDECTQYRVLPQ